jgi:hypothetical protein
MEQKQGQMAAQKMEVDCTNRWQMARRTAVDIRDRRELRPASGMSLRDQTLS